MEDRFSADLGHGDGLGMIQAQCILVHFISIMSALAPNGTPLHYSCLGNSMDRGAWWATVHGVTKTRPQLNKEHATHTQPSDHQVLDPGVGTPALSGGLGGAWMQTPAGRGRTGWMTFGASRYWEQPEQPALGPKARVHGSGTLLHGVGERSSPPWVTSHPGVVPEAAGGWGASQGAH